MDPPSHLPTTLHLPYPLDSVDSVSSPRSSHLLPNLPPPLRGTKLRLMCSYGGHIIPRPHDKSLCYVGGETRIVAVDRSHSSLPSLSSRLSRALLNGRPFTLKYQLPGEDLDSLVSVTTDDDLVNMFEEYDRLTSSSSGDHVSSDGRIRLFLFFNKPETTVSMGSLLDDAKSETWFIDALNGSGMLLPRNLSDSATMDTCLVNLESDINVDLGNVVVEEQLAQINFAQAVQRQQVMGEVGSGESLSRILSDDERSDQDVPVSFRKPPLPLPLLPIQYKVTGAFYNLPSPDSVASDTSIASPGSLSKPMHYQDQSQVANKPPLSPGTKADPPRIPTSHFQNKQVQDQNYTMHPNSDQQQQQQQYFAVGAHLHSRPPANQMAMPSSYAVYASPQQQQQQQQYSVYVMPMQHARPYMAVQSDMIDPKATTPNQSSRAAATSTKVDQVPQTLYTTAMTSAPSLVLVPESQFQNQFAGYLQLRYPNKPIPTAAPAGANSYAYDYSSNVYYTQQQQVATPLPPQYHIMTPAAGFVESAAITTEQHLGVTDRTGENQ